MAQKTAMRLLGVVENMSGDVFGSGGGERLAEELGVPLLGGFHSILCCASAAMQASR
jgi:Mrp family chromosome partitioning ATPase